MMFKIGSQVPKHAPFPPTLTDIHTGIAGIDVAYHMNHRKNGQVMFNPESGTMLEGIGHYRYERVPDRSGFWCTAKTPTPATLTAACCRPWRCASRGRRR